MSDIDLMRAAMGAAETVRATTSPNPWVGCAIRLVDGTVVTGATQPPGGRHAERVALDAVPAGAARGATVAVTLEPCSHHGRTPPCADALVEAGVSRVIVGTVDPDHRVAGTGLDRLRSHGIDVVVGVLGDAVEAQLRAYLHHRRTGRPFVVLKMAATLDGRTAAADGTSRWITSPDARRDVHRLRHESDAVLVGAGTVRADDPELTVRDLPEGDVDRQPRRIVLGRAPDGARVHPCTEIDAPLDDVLEQLGSDGVLQLLVEGGAAVAADFHRSGLVDRYVLYLAPALMGGDDGTPLFRGMGTTTMHDLWRGRIVSTTQVGPDLRVVLEP